MKIFTRARSQEIHEKTYIDFPQIKVHIESKAMIAQMLQAQSELQENLTEVQAQVNMILFNCVWCYSLHAIFYWGTENIFLQLMNIKTTNDQLVEIIGKMDSKLEKVII